MITKLDRQEFLQRLLWEYTWTEPKLSLDDLAEVIAWELPDLTSFLKAYQKALKTQI